MNDPSIQIQKGDVSITCTDPAQAAALVNLLIGAPASAAPPPVAKAKPGPKPRAAAVRTEEAPTEGRGGVKARILAFVEKNPVVDKGALSELLYGENTTVSRSRVGVALGAFVKRGSLRKLANGEYRVVA